MAQQVTNYVCPSCGGPLHFEAKLGKLKCDYCDSTFTVEEVQKLYEAKNEKAEEAAAAAAAQESHTVTGADFHTAADINVESGWGKDAQKIRTYSCTTCGAELVCDDTTAATSCPYCGNPTIIPAQFAGMLKPDYVIPFTVEKEEAIQKLKSYYQGKRLLPKSFLSGNHLEEIKGVYVPFWLFNGTVDGEMRFEGTRSHITREGNYQVTRTEHFDVQRAATLTFEKIPVDASSKMADDLMDSIEPYDYKQLKPFALEYLPGYLANKYDVEIDDCNKRAENRAVNSTVSAIHNTVSDYDSVSETGRRMKVNQDKTEYALMPVWLLHTKWNNEDFMFAMNGQTAKMIGDLPVSKPKLFAWITGIALCVAVVLFMLMGMDMESDALLISIIGGLIVGGITGGIMNAQMKPVARSTMATGYVDKSSSELRLRNDVYLRTTEQRVPIQQASGTRPGGPGGAQPGGQNINVTIGGAAGMSQMNRPGNAGRGGNVGRGGRR